MNYSACIPAIFSGTPIHQALPWVREAGLDRYEFWGWWDQDTDAILAAQQACGLTPVGLCTRYFTLNDPDFRNTYLEGLAQTIAVCQKLGCKAIITQVGQEVAHLTRQAQHESIVAGLTACIPLLEASGITLMYEPLNTRVDHKGYYLWSCQEAFEIHEEVNHPQVKVLLDLYHQYAMDDLNLPLITANLDRIGHFHIAGYPGRHEPLVDSEVDYQTILGAIRQAGYQGTVGLEYFPVHPAAEGLKTLYAQLKTF